MRRDRGAATPRGDLGRGRRARQERTILATIALSWRDADGQDRDVVVEAVAGGCEQLDERLHHVGSSRRREAADELLQDVLVVTVALGVDPGFGEAVGVEQQGVSGFDAQLGSCEVSIGDDPDELALSQVAEVGRPGGAQDRRRGVAAGGQRQPRAADLVHGRGVVVGRGLDARDRRQLRRQETALQHGREPLHPLAFPFGRLARVQQLAFVGAPVAGVEHGAAHDREARARGRDAPPR